jgi:hypothetical protein
MVLLAVKRVIRPILLAANACVAVGLLAAPAGASGGSPFARADVLVATTKDWIMRAPESLGTQADLELNAAAVQICTDEIHKLVGHRPSFPPQFFWTYTIVDDSPQFSAATADGVVSFVSSDFRLVEDYARGFRENVVRNHICYGPHEVTHVLTADGWGTHWATEGLAQLTDYLFQEADWRCCSAPQPHSLTCSESGYQFGTESHPYSDLSNFVPSIYTYNTAACFWVEVLERGGLPAIRRALASIRVDPPATSGDLVVRNVGPAVGEDLRPIAKRYGFSDDDLAARPHPLAPATPRCRAGTTADGEVGVGTVTRDTLRGTRGKDFICGLAGNDLIVGGDGADVLQGGAGADVIRARDGRRDVVECGDGRDTVQADRVDRLASCERIKRSRRRAP